MLLGNKRSLNSWAYWIVFWTVYLTPQNSLPQATSDCSCLWTFKRQLTKPEKTPLQCTLTLTLIFLKYFSPQRKSLQALESILLLL